MSPATRQVSPSATMGFPHRHSEEWGQMSATADVHQYLAVNIPDRQQLRARVGVRLAFKPDWLNRSLSGVSSNSDEKFSAVRSNACFVSDRKVLISNRCWRPSPQSPGGAKTTTRSTTTYNSSQRRPQEFSAIQSKNLSTFSKQIFIYLFIFCHWFKL